MNWLVTLEEIKGVLGLGGTTARDEDLARIIELASREVEGDCGRKFYTWIEARVHQPSNTACTTTQRLTTEDLLAVSEIASDEEDDLTFADAWDAGTWRTWPLNGWPKGGIDALPRQGRSLGARLVRITGTWGYGDGASALPWSSLTRTVTLADAATKAATSAGDPDAGALAIERGMTLLLGSEQVFVESATAPDGEGDQELVVARGVNGTTAAVHAAAAAAKALYAARARIWCEHLVKLRWHAWVNREDPSNSAARVEDYSYQKKTPEQMERDRQQTLWGLIRAGI